MGEVRALTRPWADVVGRETEQARVDAFLSALPEGAQALLVRGEPGIGKTSLWRGALAEARRRRRHVLVARPAEEEASLPLGGLLDLFDGDAIDETGLDREETQFTHGRSVLTELRQLGESGPALLAIDDLQWLDASSARALRYALRRLDREPVGVLATIRRGHADPLTVASTLPPGRSETLDLGPLGLRAMRRLLSGTVTTISRPRGRARARRGRRAARRPRHQAPGRLPGAAHAIEACAGAGELATAGRLLERVADQAAALDAPWPNAAVTAARGAVLLARGDADEAAAALGEAAAAFRDLGYRPDAARARLLEGRALLRAGRRSRATNAIGEARGQFTAMAAAGWEARAATELERASPGRASGELTPAESRIAGLVAQGMKTARSAALTT